MATVGVKGLTKVKFPTKDVLVAQRLGRRTFDQAIAGLSPGRGAFEFSRSTQPSVPPASVDRVPAFLAGVKAGCVHLCRMASSTACVISIWQVS